MMLDRDRLGFWTRFVAIFLAVVFVGSGVFMGIGTGVSYNLLDLFGGGQQQGGTTVDPQAQIDEARQAVEAEPDNPRNVTRLAALLIQNNRPDEAQGVLEQGREDNPDDPVIPLYLGQIYEQQAQGVPQEEQGELYRKAAESYAASAQIDPEEPQTFLLAGQAYEQAGDPGRAIQYYNGYLDLEPEGEQADAVRQQISTLLAGGTQGEEPPAETQP